MERNIKLEPLKTVIGEITGKFNGELHTFNVLYGNVCYPLADGRLVKLPEKNYLNTVVKFLDSEEGKEYIIPEKSEIERVNEEIKKTSTAEVTKILIENFEIKKEEEIVFEVKEEPTVEEPVQEEKKEEVVKKETIIKETSNKDEETIKEDKEDELPEESNEDEVSVSESENNIPVKEETKEEPVEENKQVQEETIENDSFEAVKIPNEVEEEKETSEEEQKVDVSVDKPAAEIVEKNKLIDEQTVVNEDVEAKLEQDEVEVPCTQGAVQDETIEESKELPTKTNAETESVDSVALATVAEILKINVTNIQALLKCNQDIFNSFLESKKEYVNDYSQLKATLDDLTIKNDEIKYKISLLNENMSSISKLEESEDNILTRLEEISSRMEMLETKIQDIGKPIVRTDPKEFKKLSSGINVAKSFSILTFLIVVVVLLQTLGFIAL